MDRAPYDAYTSFFGRDPEASEYLCECCGQEIYVGEDFYDFEGTAICEYCLRDYASQFIRVAEAVEANCDDWRDADAGW